jgi:Tfp pilus assembly protein PilP
MLFRKYLFFFLVVLLSANLWVTAKGEKSELQEVVKKNSKDAAGKSLIRKDLLFEKREKLSPPRRNIFSPLAEGQVQAETLPQEVGISQKGSSPSREDSEVYSDGAKPDLRYIGYVKSGQKIIALIFFEGEALAVEESEMISAGLRVGKVTSEEIELIDASSQKWKYSLEGEEE